MMARLHLFEIGDQPWIPSWLRDLLTDSLQFGITRFRFYDAAAPVLADLLRRSDTNRVVDLCSGATGPWLTLVDALRREGIDDLEVRFTDKHVNARAVHAVERPGDPRLVYVSRPIDAREVPPDVPGVRTMFTGFHHFTPDDARRVLASARRNREAIGIFEITERTVASCVAAAIVPVAMFFTTPLMRPLTWQRLLCTYLLPLVPLCSLWDGVVSSLRSYSQAELEELVTGLSADDYRWEIGRLAGSGPSPNITYLLGIPS